MGVGKIARVDFVESVTAMPDTGTHVLLLNGPPILGHLAISAGTVALSLLVLFADDEAGALRSVQPDRVSRSRGAHRRSPTEGRM